MPKVYEKTIKINADLLSRLHYWLTDNSDTSERLGEDGGYHITAIFQNGYEMDIKCSGTEDTVAWTEAVLFDPKGYEICHTDVSDEFLGDWELSDDNDNVYIAHVIARNT